MELEVVSTSTKGRNGTSCLSDDVGLIRVISGAKPDPKQLPSAGFPVEEAF
jgi:hypothetical protein